MRRIERAPVSYKCPLRRDLLERAARTKDNVIVGAVAVGPEAGQWSGQLALAVRARIPLETLMLNQPGPPLSEGRGSAGA